MARKAVRLSDIAEKLGVSTVTVSNALANQRGVSEELREKIKEMASEMGYHAPGTQIMAKTAVNIGVLVQERYLGNGSSFYWRLYQELAIACAAHNCLLAFCVLKPDEEKNTVLPVMVRKKVMISSFCVRSYRMVLIRVTVYRWQNLLVFQTLSLNVQK